jgi:hypothetical protein
MENFDLGVQLEDLMICHDDISGKSTDTWKTGLELSKDMTRSSQALITKSANNARCSPS